ncbi:MAG TPA: ribonuclease P protein component 2 [Euryarchaeota archaeon]|nr:ribonuclease P protein component 2 [archaeon BMS3Bbin16]HDH28438.1 ribonuclease P protein component 2 [Euryarchaeota archaeon]HDY73660.1 ribonuclease P protein component 2 [Euryarchaeota archaeon]
MSIAPTLRPNKRYIAFKVNIEGPIKTQEAVKTILREATGFFGENTASRFGLWLTEFDEEKKQGILSCNRKYKGEAVAALTLIGSVGGSDASFQVLGVSGTIKALKRKFLKDGSNMSAL